MLDFFVFRPARMELKTFSCYDNFVECDRMGSPVQRDGAVRQQAIGHLHHLLQVAGDLSIFLVIMTRIEVVDT